MEYNLKSEKIPMINGILYSDGTIDHFCICYDEKRRRYIEKQSNAQDEIYESYIGITSECQFDDLDLKVSVGEGSLGGDGFVLAETLSSGSFLWLIAFEESNPFISLRRANEKLFAENNNFEVWQIDITELTKPKIAIIKQSRFLR